MSSMVRLSLVKWYNSRLCLPSNVLYKVDFGHVISDLTGTPWVLLFIRKIHMYLPGLNILNPEEINQPSKQNTSFKKKLHTTQDELNELKQVLGEQLKRSPRWAQRTQTGPRWAVEEKPKMSSTYSSRSSVSSWREAQCNETHSLNQVHWLLR